MSSRIRLDDLIDVGIGSWEQFEVRLSYHTGVFDRRWYSEVVNNERTASPTDSFSVSQSFQPPSSHPPSVSPRLSLHQSRPSADVVL
jgi:hypothetical protein